MTFLQAVVTIIVALISGLGGSFFSYRQFIIKRKDEREEKSTQRMIDYSIKKAREDISQEIKDAVQQGIVDCGTIGDKAIREVQEEFVRKLEEGLKERSQEGAERFNKHAESIEDINRQIEANSIQIGKLTEISTNVLKSMDALNRVVTVSAESQRNSNYDRLLIVTNKILKSGRMTIADKTNLKQLYESWQALKGEDPKMKVMYDECMKITPSLEE